MVWHTCDSMCMYTLCMHHIPCSVVIFCQGPTHAACHEHHVELTAVVAMAKEAIVWSSSGPSSSRTRTYKVVVQCGSLGRLFQSKFFANTVVTFKTSISEGARLALHIPSAGTHYVNYCYCNCSCQGAPMSQQQLGGCFSNCPRRCPHLPSVFTSS